MQRVLERLMGTAVSVDDEEEEEEDGGGRPGTTQPRRQGANCTLAALCEWYEHKTRVGDDYIFCFFFTCR